MIRSMLLTLYVLLLMSCATAKASDKQKTEKACNGMYKLSDGQKLLGEQIHQRILEFKHSGKRPDMPSYYKHLIGCVVLSFDLMADGNVENINVLFQTPGTKNIREVAIKDLKNIVFKKANKLEKGIIVFNYEVKGNNE